MARSHSDLPPTPRASVLVADDDSALRRLVAEEIRARGHLVTELADGGRLLVALAQSLRDGGPGVPHLVISDIRMPVVSGLAIALAMRELEANVPLILMTAFPDPELDGRVRALGAHLLAKPFEPDTLTALVEVCLATRAGHALRR